jgi:hypothetical protein
VKGKRVLAGLAARDGAKAPFVKVLPLEYKRVLESRRKAAAAAQKDDGALHAATPKAASR